MSYQPAQPQALCVVHAPQQVQEEGNQPELDVTQQAVQAVQEPRAGKAHWRYPDLHTRIPPVELHRGRIGSPIHVGHVPPAIQCLRMRGCTACVDHHGLWSRRSLHNSRPFRSKFMRFEPWWLVQSCLTLHTRSPSDPMATYSVI